MASFRSSERGGGKLSRRFSSAGSVAGSPFSQSQVLHLMKTEFARARRYGFPVSCMLIQVDRLDSLVDLHGVALRETVREEFNKLVQEKTRGADHLGLASEDRHLIVMPHTPAEGAVLVGERLREGFEDLEVRVGANVLALHLSVGIASSDEQDTLFFDTLMAQAEAALQYSVSDGGNLVSLFNKDQIPDVGDGSDDPKSPDS